MRKAFLVMMMACAFLLSACSKEEVTLEDKFESFHFNSDSGVFTTTRGTEMVVDDLGKEDTVSEPRVVLSMWIGNTEPDQKVYNWCTMPIEERKADLKECGDMVVEFAKNEGWDNDYYLYITIESAYNSQDIVYDYEDDELYIPKNEYVFCNMYEEFGTMSKKDVAEMDGGIDFLVNNGIGYIKHNEIEYYKNIRGSASIYEGEFSISLDEDDYTVY